MTIHQQVTQAYWPKGGNSSADREAGDAFVDGLTLAQIKEIWQQPFGPSFCMARRRVTALLATILRIDEINNANSMLEAQQRRLVDLIEKANQQMEWLVELRQ